MTIYKVYCEKCGDICQRNIKKRSERKRDKHTHKTGHYTTVNKINGAAS